MTDQRASIFSMPTLMLSPAIELHMTESPHRSPAMRPLIVACLSSMLLFVWRPGQAEDAGAFMNGSKLLEACRPLLNIDIDLQAITTHAERNHCLGYLAGAGGSAEFVHASAWCVPEDEININKLITITVNYLESHPEAHSGSAAAAVWTALTDSYPCPK